MGVDYYSHNTEGYIPRPEFLLVPSRPPSAERTAEDQPFYLVPRHPDEPGVRVDISPLTVSFTASQFIEQDALYRKNAASSSSAQSVAEYVYNYPEIL